MKFTLDVTLPERILANRGDDVEDAFTAAVLAIPGVASVFGVNDFVTITRVPDADWDPIVCAVEEAAAKHLPSGQASASAEAVERARALLRAALTRPAATRWRSSPVLIAAGMSVPNCTQLADLLRERACLGEFRIPPASSCEGKSTIST